LNWRRGQTLELRKNEYDHRNEDDLEIVPPLWQKSFDKDPYTSIWQRTRESLSRTKALFVIGYSMPETDVFTQAALRIDVRALDFLCIVNPDPEARDRIVRTLRSAISVRTHLIFLDYMKDLGSLLPEPGGDRDEATSPRHPGVRGQTRRGQSQGVTQAD
jgi:hypothetical protein